MDPIKYIFEKPTLKGKISCWQMLLFKFDIVFVVRKVIKGQPIADYLADWPLNDLNFSESLFPNEDVLAIEPEPSNVKSRHWKIYFDKVANSTGNGVGANPCFNQAEFQLQEQCYRVPGMHSGLTSRLGVWRI